jgi:hypothetical protein
MKHEICLRDEFGVRLCDGTEALRFRDARLNLILRLGFQNAVVLDFSGIRSANSSFMNALLCGVVEEFGPSVLRRVSFRGCLPAVKVLVQSAIDIGAQRYSGHLSQESV